MIPSNRDTPYGIKIGDSLIRNGECFVDRTRAEQLSEIEASGFLGNLRRFCLGFEFHDSGWFFGIIGYYLEFSSFLIIVRGGGSNGYGSNVLGEGECSRTIIGRDFED